MDDNTIKELEARIAENEAVLERRRPREIDEVDFSSAEGVLTEILAAYEAALEQDKTKVARHMPKRLYRVLEHVRKSKCSL